MLPDPLTPHLMAQIEQARMMHQRVLQIARKIDERYT
jgi:hypothetical protein